MKQYPIMTPDEYLASVSSEQLPYMEKLRKAIKKNLDKGFQEGVSYGMLGYAVPHSIYPDGYHCDKKQPLPFAGLAAQKNSINLYHMGIYSDDSLSQWFQSEYAKVCKYKLDMGKSCIRFKKYEDIPYSLIEDLFSKMSVKNWIQLYEKNLKRG